eukprot:TRINITY_DN129_c0_g1_i1.p1 TRINITY_DN129_c0_g1~~TRINITY_DN129_c0_g1_i1.p1  ORF type:complete len:194 (-),score=32.57 TRINITY_DN129_c0_g1_i1:76-657(-)
MRIVVCCLFFLLLASCTKAYTNSICDVRCDEPDELFEDLIDAFDCADVGSLLEDGNWTDNPSINYRQYFLSLVNGLFELVDGDDYRWTLINSRGDVLFDTSNVVYDSYGEFDALKTLSFIECQYENYGSKPEVLQASLCGYSGWDLRFSLNAGSLRLYYAERFDLDYGDYFVVRISKNLEEEVCDEEGEENEY